MPSELSVCVENSVPNAEVGAVIATIFAVVEIVKLVVSAERQKLDGCPAEIVPAVSTICIPDSQHEPTYQRRKMEGAKKQQDSHVDQGGDRLDEEELDHVEVETRNGDTGGVLVVGFVEGVEEGPVHEVVEAEEEEILYEHHHYYLRDYVAYRWCFGGGHYQFEADLRVNPQVDGDEDENIEGGDDDTFSEKFRPFVRVLLPGPWLLQIRTAILEDRPDTARKKAISFYR